MKKVLFIMMAFMASLGAYAQEVNTDSEINARGPLVTPYPLLSVVSVNQSELTLPWTFSVPAPYETVAEVYGPTGPNTCVWNVQNGYLYVTITEDAGPEILQQGQYFFTVRTTSSSYYTLVFEVR